MNEEYENEIKLFKKYNNKFLDSKKRICMINIYEIDFKILKKEKRNKKIKKEIKKYRKFFDEYIENSLKYTGNENIEELEKIKKDELTHLRKKYIKK